MCDEAVDDCLAALKFIRDWFVTRKMLEMFHDSLLANDDILFFDENFSKVTFMLVKWVSVVKILVKLTLMMIITFLKIILILLFILDFWLGITNLKNAKHFRKR